MFSGPRTLKQTAFANSSCRLFIRKSLRVILSFLTLPLISCIPNSSQAMPIIASPVTPIKLNVAKCSLEISNNGSAAKLVYRKNKVSLDLDIPEDVKINKPIQIFCDDKRTTIVTSKYIIRTLGHANLANGNQMLGYIHGLFYPTNAFLLSLEPLGKVFSVMMLDSILTVVTSKGIYKIDVDQPSQPAKRIKM